MWYVIKWTKEGYTHITFTQSGLEIAMRFALMRECQGYSVDIDTCSDEDIPTLKRKVS